MIKKLLLLNKSPIQNKPKTKDLKEQESQHRSMSHKQTLKSRFVKIRALNIKILMKRMKKFMKNIQANNLFLKGSK